MCRQCNKSDKWEMEWCTVKNSGTEPLYITDQYHGVLVIIEPGETRQMYLKVNFPR